MTNISCSLTLREIRVLDPRLLFRHRTNSDAEVNVRGFIEFISNYDLLSLSVTQPDEKFYKDFEEATSFESRFLGLEMFSRIRDFVSQRMRKTFNSVILQNDSSANLIIGYKIQKFVAGVNAT